jgi:hypothetical protein
MSSRRLWIPEASRLPEFLHDRVLVYLPVVVGAEVVGRCPRRIANRMSQFMGDHSLRGCPDATVVCPDWRTLRERYVDGLVVGVVVPDDTGRDRVVVFRFLQNPTQLGAALCTFDFPVRLLQLLQLDGVACSKDDPQPQRIDEANGIRGDIGVEIRPTRQPNRIFGDESPARRDSTVV